MLGARGEVYAARVDALALDDEDDVGEVAYDRTRLLLIFVAFRFSLLRTRVWFSSTLLGIFGQFKTDSHPSFRTPVSPILKLENATCTSRPFRRTSERSRSLTRRPRSSSCRVETARVFSTKRCVSLSLSQVLKSPRKSLSRRRCVVLVRKTPRFGNY